MSASFREFVLEQLGRVQPVSDRRMFGGVGLYAGGHFFGLIDNDLLYFKVNDTTRGEYEALGSRPFQPFGEGTKPMTGYYEVPGDILESELKLRIWMEAAIRVAATAKTGGARSRSRSRSPKAAAAAGTQAKRSMARARRRRAAQA